MKVFNGDQLSEAQDHRPQIERFVGQERIYVIETPADYARLPADLKTIAAAKEATLAAG